jgi:1,4-dihydroxy-2-naphthoyl-CoA hydrolase
MLHALGIRFTGAGEDYLEAAMPVDARTRQPAGILHGGASCVLAETLGSVASNLVVGDGEAECLGIEINANHLNAVRDGTVTGRVTPTRLGRSLHVWDIRITDERGRLTCVSRLTVMVRPKRSGS